MEEEDTSVVVLASDLGIDARPFLVSEEQIRTNYQEEENWHDCPSTLTYTDDNQDFFDLDELQIFSLQGFDKSGNRIVRIVGKYFPGQFRSHTLTLYF